MALSDCSKCWETPCMCGHDYQGWPTTRILELSKVLSDILDERLKKESHVRYSHVLSQLPETFERFYTSEEVEYNFGSYTSQFVDKGLVKSVSESVFDGYLEIELDSGKKYLCRKNSITANDIPIGHRAVVRSSVKGDGINTIGVMK